MTLTLSRVDYTTVGVTSRGTTKILPSTDSKQPQKFAVADRDGVLHVFGVRKGELRLSFKSLPGAEISRLVLGGVRGSQAERIFVAYGHSVRGFTRKGKLFLEFDTGLMDPIVALYVLGPDLAACSTDLYHRYRDCKDVDSYLVGETLQDVILLPSDTSGVYAVLACGDRAIRVLHGSKSPSLLRLPSVPTVLTLCRDTVSDFSSHILVGTIDGRIGLLILRKNESLGITWLVGSMGSEVTSLDLYEFQEEQDILVGRLDGSVDVYALSEDEDTPPALRYHYNCGESVTSVAGGMIGTLGYPEILVTTYSGRIFGLTTKPLGLLEVDRNDVELPRLKAEIQQLEEKLAEEKFATSHLMVDALAPLSLSVNHRLTLNRATASYLLSIELDTPIENILIQSDAPVELLDVESNSAVISLSACNPSEGNFVLATYRCQVNTNRLELRLRTIEGQPGTLQVYVTSQMQPKCCRRVQIPIRALSLHARFHEDEENETTTLPGGPFNELRFTGQFTLAEMHAWLSLALPEMPERPHLQDGEATLTFTSCLIGTILKCKYKKGSATFLGENVSSIMILRDALTKEATKRKTKLDVFCGTAFLNHRGQYS
ncbi:Bardet-Biedl syndrome 7 protein homolog isoform X2 [Orussus abietinus]|uniref:Bardet-Biedl syndrome 7 protein homolog isoform X2 n=1 Tax=Orussus abietinus TaxID=222816 RepID=UPI000626A3AD|nr:Bardet-Biedl syndrome 7 protein homolog isoform X2 [Orussus abietinus]